MEILSLHFIRPWWLVCLPFALIVPALWRFYRRPSGDWSKVCDDHLLKWLSVGEKSSRPGLKGSVVAALVLILSALALAGPSWQQLPDTSYSAPP